MSHHGLPCWIMLVGISLGAAGCGGTASTNAAKDTPPHVATSTTARAHKSVPRTTTTLGTPRGGKASCDSLRCGPPATTPPCPAHQSVPSFNGSYCGPVPSAGNGFGPQGECTGREVRPPCGPGMPVGHFYSYTLPGRCDGRLILDGRHWISELPPPKPVPDMYVWVSVGWSQSHAGFISPAGSVGFDVDHGQPAHVCGN